MPISLHRNMNPQKTDLNIATSELSQSTQFTFFREEEIPDLNVFNKSLDLARMNGLNDDDYSFIPSTLEEYKEFPPNGFPFCPPSPSPPLFCEPNSTPWVWIPTGRRATLVIRLPKERKLSRTEIIKKITKSIRKLPKTKMEDKKKIVLVFRRHHSSKKKNLKMKESLQGNYKNLPKILGNAIISFCLKETNDDIIENFIRKPSKWLPKNNSQAILKRTHKNFATWIISSNLRKRFVNLQEFRDIWGIKNKVFDEKNFENSLFCMVLRRVSKYFIQDEFIPWLLQKVVKKKIKKENAMRYLQKLWVFSRGINDPKSLHSIE